MIHGATIEFSQRLAEGLNRLKHFLKASQKIGPLDSTIVPARKVMSAPRPGKGSLP